MFESIVAKQQALDMHDEAVKNNAQSQFQGKGYESVATLCVRKKLEPEGA